MAFRKRWLHVSLAVASLVLSLALNANPIKLTANISTLNAEALRFDNGSFSGLLSDGYNCVYDRISYDIQTSSVPHARILENLKAGKVDLGFPLLRTRGRDEFSVFTSSMHTVRFMVIGSKDEDALDLFVDQYVEHRGSLSFAVKIGTYTEKYASEVVPKRQDLSVVFHRVNDWAQAIKMAKLGRVTAAIVPDLVYRNMGVDESDLRVIPSSTVFHGAIYVSNKTPSLSYVLNELNGAISECKDEGVFDLK